MSEADDPKSRAVVLPLAAVVTLSGAHFASDVGLPTVAAILLVCVAWLITRAVVPTPRPRSPVDPALMVMGLTALGLTIHLRESVGWFDRNNVTGSINTLAHAALLVGAGAALVGVGTRSRRVGVAAVLLMVASNAAVGALVASAEEPLVYDVAEFQRIGASALLEGRNPYTVTYPDIYPPEISEKVYGEGISIDGTLTRGFPYPPTSLIPALASQALGDVLAAHRIAITILAVVVLAIGRGSLAGRIGSVMVPMAPNVINLPVGGWTEPFLAVALALTVWAYLDRHRGAPIALGLFLSLKQYTVLFLPLVPLLFGDRTTPRPAWVTNLKNLGIGLLPWLVFTMVFVLWDPTAFLESVILWQFEQPFRPDSLSLLVWSVNSFQWPPPAVFSVAPVAAGLIAGVVVLLKAARSASSFALGVAFVMTFFLLFSKQAFANYYFLVVACCAVAVAAREPLDSKVPA